MKRSRDDIHGPIHHDDHPKPITRRDFLSRGFIGGAAMLAVPTWLGLLANPSRALAQAACSGGGAGGGMIPFIGFDLAGGANLAGSNAMVGGMGGQLDFLDVGGYEKLGLPTSKQPTVAGMLDTQLGLTMHAESAFLRGIVQRTSTTTRANTNGCVICARSSNDTDNNPHNPIYGINKAGASGSLVPLIGTENSESGGKSKAPESMIDPTVRPTKVDRPSDATGMVDTGQLLALLDANDAGKVMTAIEQISSLKLDKMQEDQMIEDLILCGYVDSTSLVTNFGDPNTLDPLLDPIITSAPLFADPADFDDSKFRSTATVMKLVVNGFAGAGTIELGGYDYHNGTRSRGEVRDFEAGQCVGAVLEYAAALNQQVMIYVFSDGSVDGGSEIDTSVDGGDKLVWRSDNSSTSASLILVHDPVGRPALSTPTSNQIGYFRADGSIETGANAVANNVDLLAESIVANYLQLHGQLGNLATVLPGHGLGSGATLDSLIAFQPIR